MLAEGRDDEARALLDAEMTRRHIDVNASSPLAVLRRAVDAVAGRAPRTSAPPPSPPQEPPAPSRDRGGAEAVALYATTVSYGLMTGAWLDVQLDVTELKALAWIPLLGAGAGVAVAYLADNPRSMRRGLPTALGAGLTLGLLAGGAIGAQGWRAGDWGVPTMSTLAWAGATAGLGVGLGAGLLLDPMPGSGSFVLSGGLWGSALGVLTGYAFDVGTSYDLFTTVGEGVGVLATALTARALRPTPAQVRWMDLGALTGALLGAGVGLLLLRGERAPFAGVIQLGLVGGGVAGFLFGASRDAPTPGRRALAWSAGVVPLQGGAMLTVGAL